MPTYDYRCENEHTFEVFHSMSDTTPRTCPQCGASARRVPGGGSGFLFKGSGFYITDYRSKQYRERAKADQGGSGGGGPAGSGGAGGSGGPGGGGASGGGSSGGPAKPGGKS
jgi:putative FmdB family regulatory protein